MGPQITKVLVANRGEIARRVIHGARALGIATAVVYSDADADALFVAEADEAVRLPGTAPGQTYLRSELILDAAARVGADAIHPGYGFLSENAAFAQAVTDAGLIFVGPPAAAISAMGDKVTAKRMMAAAGVPTLAGFTIGEDGRAVPEGGGEPVEISAALAAVGLPAIVKASAGGGGRGMRIIAEPGEAAEAIASAQREAASAFGNPMVFLERYLSPSRHIEVQVIADDHGNTVALFERECSIQRRHQKIVEEAPSAFVGPELREQLCRAAVAAAQAVGYRNAGTVEFIVGADGTAAFLEMNTRLQVEHPVTEAITGLDLVALQFAVAAGRSLPPAALAATVGGHAIEVRLCAEDPAAGYLPVSGTFELFEIAAASEFSCPAGPGGWVRVDAALGSGGTVSPYYDSMIAKVIAHAPTRSGAAALLSDALSRARLHGVTTNRDLLVAILRSPQFLAGDTTTDFLDRVTGLAARVVAPETQRLHAAVAAIAGHHRERPTGVPQIAIPRGWRNNRSTLETLTVKTADGETVRIGHDLTGTEPILQVDAEPLSLTIHGADASCVDMTTGGVRRRYRVHLSDLASAGSIGTAAVDSPLGHSTFSLLDPLPAPSAGGPTGGLTAPMPGAVIRVLVSVGDIVEAGQPLLVLEAMKMEHTIRSPQDGTVAAINVAEGEQVQIGAVLAALVQE
ncbi:MAG TPA: biotin carboxylase N-terminal domain-containing protein [Sporichthyaceae bacterium]|jgi:propionyl-CoA carboxylase alpha chain|nr:biotin carboxylase N-terminal domain-containing protein [Sporichthyaceae bacterium]